MSEKRETVSCPSCGEPIRPKTMRCSACGTTNPLQERTSLEGRIGLGGTAALLIVASVLLVVLGV